MPCCAPGGPLWVVVLGFQRGERGGEACRAGLARAAALEVGSGAGGGRHAGKAMVLMRALASWRESRRVCWTTMGTSLVTTRQ
ncbi:hypothetical protein GCM10022214_54360 [Actinomadura miaoliensis]|uniref:Uncharacterized protein n=1 Tax=Actinomadura miaoliensis TaxID=430685 RepID=A0ABP7WEB8_9ACTN